MDARRRLASTAIGLAVLAGVECTGAPALSPPSRPAASFLALGDSYTVGEGVGVDERWPSQLVARLRERDVEVSLPEVIARTGWTTAELGAAITRERPRGPYRLVSLMIGVNDEFQGRPLADYGRAFASLLARAVELAGGDPGRVLVLSIPDYGVTPFARSLGRDANTVAADVGRFNDLGRAVSTRAAARWVDVTPLSRRPALESGWLAPDQLHPSARMHAEWARLALPAALAALRPPASRVRPSRATDYSRRRSEAGSRKL